MTYFFKNTKSKGYYGIKGKPVVAIIRQKTKKNSFGQSIIDYKNALLLRKFISREGKILPRRVTGLNAKQQRYIAKAIKNARLIGLLPFITYSSYL